jgi:hypothetical protein
VLFVYIDIESTLDELMRRRHARNAAAEDSHPSSHFSPLRCLLPAIGVVVNDQ